MDLNDVSDYFYNSNLEAISDHNSCIYSLIANSTIILNYSYFDFHNGGYILNKLKYNCTCPKRKEGVAIDINNNINHIYIDDYTTLESLHKFNLNETFPIVIYDPNLNEDDWFYRERQIYGFE